MQVDQAGQRDQSVGVDPLRVGGGVGRVDEQAVADQQVRPALAEQVGAGDQQSSVQPGTTSPDPAEAFVAPPSS